MVSSFFSYRLLLHSTPLQALMRKVQTLLHQLSLLEQSSFRSSWLHHILMTFDVSIEIPLIRHAQKSRLMLVDLAWVADASEMAVTKLQARASDLVNEDLNDILEYMRLASSSNTRHPPSSSSVTQVRRSARFSFASLPLFDAWLMHICSSALLCRAPGDGLAAALAAHRLLAAQLPGRDARGAT